MKKVYLSKYNIFFLLLLLILLFPVQGESQASTVPGTVRVGIAQDVQRQEFSVRGSYRLVDQNNQILASVAPGESWEVRSEGGVLRLYKNGRQAVTAGSTVCLRQANQANQASQSLAVLGGNGALINVGPSASLMVIGAGGGISSLKMDGGISILSGSGTFGLDSNGNNNKDINLVAVVLSGRVQNYRGNMEFRLQGGGITVINELPLEEYLYGVVAREMPASWPIEALKAQAVASRTYALSLIGANSSCGFDLLATQMGQMYGGYNAEVPMSVQAVDETRGIVILYKGKPISAFFHSSSGGYTENAQDVWREQLDYIKSKPDPFDRNDENYNWVVTYSQQELVSQLNSKKSLFSSPGSPDRAFSEVDGIDLLEKTSSGVRIKRIRVTGKDTAGQTYAAEIFNSDDVRMALGLKSALFAMNKVNDAQGRLATVTFTGSGFGHGLGMSQYGALGMARQGYNYQDILKYYYTNVVVGPLAGAE